MSSYKKDYIRIQNLSQYILKDIPKYHPDEPRYIPYWKNIKKMCIEGLWGIESVGYRYCPGRLFFYGNFCTILDFDEEQKTREKIKPDVRDLEWERAYMILEAEGFSGWSLDDEYTSDELYFKYKELGLPNIQDIHPKHQKRFLQIINKDGHLKKYITPRQNIRKTHPENMGVPLYWNTSKNIIELGARSSGKSYWYSLAVAKYEIVFDGVKYYDDEAIKNPKKAEVCVGAGQQAKSADFVKKIEDSINMLAIDHGLGVWGRPGDMDYEPSVFYKEMTGTLKPNNKDNLWRHEYKVLENGAEIIEGTGSCIAHVVYSAQKRDGAEAAAGGRYSKNIVEEIGLCELLTKVWGSNNSTVSVEGTQIGNQIGLGTSGNMETIIPAKEIFTHPHNYNVVAYNDDWEESGDIAFFVPVYMSDRSFKDKDGNTDYDAAIEKYVQRRIIAERADNPHILAIEKMNSPLVPSDMWQTNKGNLLPVNEAELREKALRNDRLYEKIGTPVELVWDSKQENGVKYSVLHNANPFYEPKYRYERDSLDGCIMIYDFPRRHPGLDYKIPDDMYKFIGHDPYVSDNIDEGDSLGVSYIVMNPKYISDGFPGNTIVASYIGKPTGGRKEYYSNLEKLMALYGNPTRGLWFEANRGDECKNYFTNRKKTHLLALRPQRMYSTNVYATKITQYGFVVGNKVVKVDLLDKFSDWLLQETTLADGTKRNIERIPCMFLIKQIQQFNLEKGNFDAVSAMLGCILGMKEEEFNTIEEIQKKHNVKNNLSFLSMNPKIFKDVDDTMRLRSLNRKHFGEKVPYLPNKN